MSVSRIETTGGELTVDLSGFEADILQAGGMDYGLTTGAKEVPEVLEAASDFTPERVQKFVAAHTAGRVAMVHARIEG